MQHLAQHRVGVLAADRRRQVIIHRRLRQFDRIADQIDGALAGQRMRHRDLHAAEQDLRVLEHLVDIVDGAAGHAEIGQPLDPVRLRFLRRDSMDQTIELHPVAHARGVGLVFLVLRPFRLARELGELLELAVIADREDEKAVGAGHD